MSDPIVLQPVLDLKAAGPLKTTLLERRGEPLAIDAGAVQRLGGLCLQVLLAARRAWADDGHKLEFTPRSEAFSEALQLFGAGAYFDDASLEGGRA
jgi:chemotaxis protein CheX